MTKEEYIGKYPIVCNNAGTKLYLERDDVLKAMDVFAKQQAIAFANYIHLNYQPEAIEVGYWYDQHDPRNQNPITTEWIYNQFIEK